MGTGTVFQEVKRPRRQADHSLPATAEVKEREATIPLRREQWPRGLRHELPSLARTLRSWVRISLKVCIFVLIAFSLFMFFCA
jgi:hypothetical protein